MHSSGGLLTPSQGVLHRVQQHSAANKMEPRNLAIVVGPNLLWPRDRDMAAAVGDSSPLTHLCELFITYCDWFFPTGETTPDDPLPPTAAEAETEEAIALRRPRIANSLNQTQRPRNRESQHPEIEME